MSAPTGWLDLNTKQPNPSLTREYMSAVLEWLYDLRPLVEKGIIILIPAEQIVHDQLQEVGVLSMGVTELIEPIEDLAASFSPEEITVDDNRKGLFTFAGGNHVPQLRRAIGHGIHQFAKDVVIANSTQSIYTAPFKWEQYLGKNAISRFAASEYHATIIEGLRNLRLPILANLSPDVLLKIHEDSKYTEFRIELRKALRNIRAEIGSRDFADRVAQIERDILLPKITAIHRETESSRFKAATNAAREGFFTFTQTFLSNVPTGLNIEANLVAGGIAGGLSFLREVYSEIMKARGHRIWAKLLPENPSLSTYGSPLTLKQRGEGGWEIDDKPSMRVRVSRGIYKLPFSQPE
jgi:hypothetical protein